MIVPCQFPSFVYLPSIHLYVYGIVFALLPGNIVCDLDYVVCEEGLCGRCENAGFLYFRPSYQCLQGFTTPQTPFLIAFLIHQSEVLWARILPMRLLLRLGSEYCCR